MAYNFGPSRRARVSYADDKQQPDPVAEGIRSLGGVSQDATPNGSLISDYRRFFPYASDREYPAFTVPWRAALYVDADVSGIASGGVNTLNSTVRVYAVTGGNRVLVASGTIRLVAKGGPVVSVAGRACEKFDVTIQGDPNVAAALAVNLSYAAFGFDPTARIPDPLWTTRVGSSGNPLSGQFRLLQIMGRAGGAADGIAPGQSLLIYDAAALPVAATQPDLSIPISENAPFSIDLSNAPLLVVSGLAFATSLNPFDRNAGLGGNVFIKFQTELA